MVKCQSCCMMHFEQHNLISESQAKALCTQLYSQPHSTEMAIENEMTMESHSPDSMYLVDLQIVCKTGNLTWKRFSRCGGGKRASSEGHHFESVCMLACLWMCVRTPSVPFRYLYAFVYIICSCQLWPVMTKREQDIELQASSTLFILNFIVTNLWCATFSEWSSLF